MLTRLWLLILPAFGFLLPLYSATAQTYKQQSDRIDSLYNLGQIQQAFDLSKLAQQQAEREFGKRHAKYGISMSVTGQFFQEFGEYRQAEQLMKQAVQIIEQSEMPDGEDYSFAVGVLGNLYTVLNRLPEALIYIEKSVNVRERLNGKNSEEYAEISTILALTHATAGSYEQAITEMQNVLAIRAKLHGKNHPRYAESAGNLGSIYLDIDNYIQAEPLLDEALRAREVALGKDNIYYLYSLNNLAALKSLMGDHERSITLSEETLRRLPKEYQQSTLLISTVNLLIGDYLQTKRYKQADSLVSATLPVIEKKFGKNHLRYSDILQSQAAIREHMGQWTDAENVYRQAISTCQSSVGIDNAEYLSKASSLAKLYVKMKQYAKADSIYAELLPLSEQIMGRFSIRFGQLLSSQMSIYRVQGHTKKELSVLAEANQLNENILIRQLPYWTPRQREKYMLKYMPVYLSNMSAATDLYTTSTDVTGILYQQSLFLKNLLLNQQTSSLLTINGSKNPAWLTAYRDIERLKNSINRQYTLPISQRQHLDSLEARAETLEKYLARQSAPFRQVQQALQIRWEDIRNALKPTEAAVEFVSFPYFDGRQQTDSVRYVALVLRPGDKTPQVVPLLTDETPLRRLLEYKKGVSGGATLYATRGSELDTDQITRGDSLYQLIWQPIDKLLTDTKTVYLAPSGLLHQVSFAALPYSGKSVPGNGVKKGAQYLADRYQLRQVSSTRQVAIPATETDTYESIVSAKLYGGIQYDSTETTPGSWPFLPGTQREVEQIGQLIGPKATLITGKVATETEVKKLSGQSPTVLHIATHGFAFPNPPVSRNDTADNQGGTQFRHIDDPLFRTGVLMAGANHVWQGGRPTLGEDDGILTAYEVANLNLSATKLVVLSACETALGDIQGSEGVFGLQRAFKIAGADYLLTSLWPVSDQATSELMTLFYRNWKQYKTIRSAFLQTQLQMRQKYPPSVWASFVLIE